MFIAPSKWVVLLSLSAMVGSLTKTVAAQFVAPIYYPQATTTELLENWQIFGSGSPDDAEARYQILIPPEYLPQFPAVLTGIAVINNGPPQSLTYDMLEIAVSNTNALTLSSLFDLNLVNPVVILSGLNVTLHFTRRSWDEIPVLPTFIHDGRQGIVIDIRKALNRSMYPGIGVTIQTTSSPRRDDLPRAMWDNSRLGNGAYWSAQATVFSPVPIKLTFRGFSARSRVRG